MAAPIDLNVAKKNLQEALGDEMQKYAMSFPLNETFFTFKSI